MKKILALPKETSILYEKGFSGRDIPYLAWHKKESHLVCEPLFFS